MPLQAARLERLPEERCSWMSIDASRVQKIMRSIDGALGRIADPIGFSTTIRCAPTTLSFCLMQEHVS